MPTNSAVKVTYYIRKSNGTSEETKYNPYYLTEIFLGDFTAELIDSNLDAKVSSGQNTDMVGSANPDGFLEGQILDELLIAEIETDTIIIGVVDEC